MNAEVRGLIERLGLRPLPVEGGWYRETWRSDDRIAAAELPARYGRDKSLATAILYLLTAETPSLLHRLPSPELYCFHDGAPAEMLQLHPGGRGETLRLGRDLAAGEQPQVLVPRDSWQGTRVIAGGAWTLCSVIVAPGFDPTDYEHGARAALLADWPGHAAVIAGLTRA